MKLLQPQLSKPSWLTPALGLFLLTSLVRLWVVWRATDAADVVPTHGDMKFYHEWALRIAGGTWTDHRAFYGLPLYAYGLALVYTLFGVQPYVAILLQIVAESLTTVLIYKLADQAFTEAGRPTATPVRRIGALAAVGWAFFVPAQTFSTILMPTCYLVLAFWFVVWWVLKKQDGHPSAGEFFSLGLLMGFVAMMVANILFLIPLVIIAILFAMSWPDTLRRALATRSAAAALLLAGVTIGAAPCWLHNYFVAGEPVFLSAHSGVNFWIGNSPQANGYPKIPSGLRADQQGLLQDSITFAERAAGRPLRRSEVSAYWSAKAKDQIRQHPGQWLRLLATKAHNFWSAFQYDDISTITEYRENGITLPGPRFGLIAALALPGLVLAWMRRPAARWVVAAVCLHLASLLTVFVTERYRLAAVPGLLLLAAFGLAELARGWRERRPALCAAYLSMLAVAVPFVFWPQRDPDLRTLDDYNTGIADLERGRLERAQGKLERVLAAHPDNAEANFARGNLCLAKGERDQAKHFYRRTLQIDPHHGRVLNNLGVLALQESRWTVAEHFLKGALQVNPDDAKSNFLLARACWAQGDAPTARRAIEHALELQPQRGDFQRLATEIFASADLPASLPASAPPSETESSNTAG